MLSKRSSEETTDFQNAIVEWFRVGARDLPWRKTSDPYRIWVSEVMLQQTGVSTVIPYYEKFLLKFPSLEDLAQSSEEEALKIWEGLGYYRRVKNLRAGAQLILEKFGGRFPDTKEELLSVPGIGAYSAGAILSIAFRKSHPALDGNLIRVYSRLFNICSYVDETKTLKQLWAIATEHCPKESKVVREFTEGMMELGARICTPRRPLCGLCPVQSHCMSFREGNPEILPRKRKPRQPEQKIEQVFIWERSQKLGFFSKGSDIKYPDFHRLIYQPLDFLPTVKSSKLLFQLKYSVTHRRFSVFVVRGRPPQGVLQSSVEWYSASEFSRLLLPAIDRKIIGLVFPE